jgi:hypothetical protein
MVRLRPLSIIAVCASLAACTDGTATREIMAPDARPTFALSETAGDDFPLASLDDRADLMRAPQANLRAATGGRVTGSAEMMYLSSRQTYDVTALSTGQAPSAKGAIHASIVNPRTTIEIDAAVDCLVTVGNEAWVSGPVERFVLNGVEFRTRMHLLVRVQDNGEGRKSASDLVSPPFTGGPQACLAAPTLPLLADATGDVQVAPR